MMKFFRFKSKFWLIFFMAFMPHLQLFNLDNHLTAAQANSPKLSLFSQPVLAQSLSSNPVLVYGNIRCGWTNQMIQDLKARKIPYQFKNLDVQSIRDEWNQIMGKNGVPGGTPIKLPVVLVSDKLFMRPSIELVIFQRKSAQ